MNRSARSMRLSSLSLLVVRLGLVAAFLALVPSLVEGESIEPRLQITLAGEAMGDWFGYSVASAGDFNGDGFADLIVGAPHNGSYAGRAYIYYGGPEADATPDVTLTGEPGTGQFGTSAGTAGDVNGDGFADVIVGAPNAYVGGADAGRAYVYYGGPAADATPDLTFSGGPGDQFGISVGTAGDVNGDGFADVIVGAFTASSGDGRAYVFFGGPGADATPDLVLAGGAGDWFGWSVGTAGDVNDDGFADFIVGAPASDAGAGRAYVFYGGPGADVTPDLTLTGEAADDHFGTSVGTAGDVDGDGWDDVIVGAPVNDAAGTDAGRAYVYYGGPGADATPDLTLTAEAAGDDFGGSVGTAGDVNGDGWDDVIVGASQGAGGSFIGRTYVFYGGPGADATADLTLTGAPGDAFGFSVGTAGDINGDGFPDLIAGGFDNDVAYVYDMYRYIVLAPNGGETWNVGATEFVRWLGDEPADVSLSVDGGRTYDVLRHHVGGSESNSLPLLVPHAPTHFATIRVTPSDPAVHGQDQSDALFTIETDVALLTFVVAPATSGSGAELSWNTEPGVGPAGLAGYRLYRLRGSEAGNGVRVGPELITETRYTDREGTPGSTYRLVAVNGLMQELELGRRSLALAAPLAAWPLPYRGGALTISFATASAPGGGPGVAEVALYDVSGRLVRTIARGSFAAGRRTASWNGLDERGQPVRGGVYLLRASTGGESRQLKLVVLP